MTTRLSLLFNNSPESEIQTLREVVGMGYKKVPFSHLARWRKAARDGDIWALDIDVLPLDRPRVIYLLPTKSAQNSDIEACALDYAIAGNPTIQLTGVWSLEVAHREILQKNCIELCDQVFVINVDKEIDDDTQVIVDFAEEIGRRVVYLNY